MFLALQLAGFAGEDGAVGRLQPSVERLVYLSLCLSHLDEVIF
jgi:hypothetical protein